MLPLVRFVEAHAFLCLFLTSVLAKDDPDYNPSTNFRPHNVTGLGAFYGWVGSYYNATAEVELDPVFGGTLDGPFCSKLENYTSTVKFDAILSILERGSWNAGSNSVIFWLTLMPQSSPPFNVSSIGADLLYQSHGLSYPIVSTNPSPNGFWRPSNPSPDAFNFTTGQTEKGAYNLTGSLKNADSVSSGFGTNFTLPVCNETHLTSDYRVDISTTKWWNTEDWDGFRYPNFSLQFDVSTANLTLDGVFSANPYVQSDPQFTDSPTLGGPGANGFIKVRFNGALDAYHSDSLSLNSSEPTWLRTVGFENNPDNIGFGSMADRSRFGLVGAITAVMVSATVMIL